MKHIKRAPIRILIMTVLTGVICIIGMLMIVAKQKQLVEMHKDIVNHYVVNREYMAKITSTMSKHHVMVDNYVLTTNNDSRAKYEKSGLAARAELKMLVIDFTDDMKVGEQEKLYHKVYSNVCAYLSNVDTMVAYAKAGDSEMVIYYNDNVLSKFIDQVNKNVKALDDMTVNEIEAAEAKMNHAIKVSSVLRTVCIIIVLLMLALCSWYCVYVAANLDNYKIQLEQDLNEKNKFIRQNTEQVLRMQDNIISGIANLIEDRDTDTGKHVKRTSDYVEMIARSAKYWELYEDILTEEYIQRLVKAAQLHDIGKISVPDRILLKPGKLTPEEFEEIKKHAAEGGRIIRELFGEAEDQEYVRIAIEVASCHHEKWDGTGYGRGLARTNIPLSARIMAIADVFDALISKRCYKDAYDLDKAFDIIKESSGTHFDPQLADVFIRMRKDIENYLNENK